MIKSDPIIAVKDVPSSSQWYQNLFNCRSIHGGNEFDVLVDDQEQVILCLHKWDEHEHPSLSNASDTAGNGLLLYFRTDQLDSIRQNIDKHQINIETDVAINPNSHKKEFTLIDPDGYHLTIAEYHTYSG